VSSECKRTAGYAPAYPAAQSRRTRPRVSDSSVPPNAPPRIRQLQSCQTRPRVSDSSVPPNAPPRIRQLQSCQTRPRVPDSSVPPNAPPRTRQFNPVEHAPAYPTAQSHRMRPRAPTAQLTQQRIESTTNNQSTDQAATRAGVLRLCHPKRTPKPDSIKIRDAGSATGVALPG
jgi:hypothetical protein